MKTNELLIAIISTVILGSFSVRVIAENRADAYTIIPGTGAYLFDNYRGIENPALYNLSLGYNFTSNWGMEALIGMLHTDTKGTPSQATTGSLYLLDGAYHFNTSSPFEPYLLAGIGMLDLTPNGTQANTQANINGGAGLEYFVHPNIALRGDVRDIYTMTGGKNDYLINFGVSILFGGQTQAAATTTPMTTVSIPTDSCDGTKVVVRFTNDSAVIDPLYKTELQQVAACMQKNPQLNAVVCGYASSPGTAEYNLNLSQRRTNNVKNYLVDHEALPTVKIHTQGFGEANPVASNASEAGQAQNRRAETVVVSVVDTGQS